VEKVAQEFALLLQFSINWPKKKIRPKGENSPNLVTLPPPKQGVVSVTEI
jgi:hypothetical protein